MNLSTTELMLGVAGAFGLPAITFGVYRLFFYVDSEKSRQQISSIIMEQNKKEIDELKKRVEKHSDHINKLYSNQTKIEKDLLTISHAVNAMQKEVSIVHGMLERINEKLDNLILTHTHNKT